MKLRIGKWTVFAVVAALVVSGYFAWLAWEGYLFPVHYRTRSFQDQIEEGYGTRLDRYTWYKDGKWTAYWSDGIKQEEGCYRDNQKAGTWTVWGRDGLPRERTEYNDSGRAIQVTSYENGVVKSVDKCVLPGEEEEPDPPSSTIPLRDELAEPARGAPKLEVDSLPSGLAKEVNNSLGMKLVLIPAGNFVMGNSHRPKDEVAALTAYYGQFLGRHAFHDEYPQHRVQISRPFYLGAYLVTVGQFRRFVESSGYKTDAEANIKEGGEGFDAKKNKFIADPRFSWRNVGFDQTDDYPVLNVSWNDAVAFCKWLSQQEGKTYRLPTEAEWEYACRAGTTTRYSNGDDPELLTEVANLADATYSHRFPVARCAIHANDGFIFTSPVGRFRPNRFGLFDMHGNAAQWCVDWYAHNYYESCPLDEPPGPPAGNQRVCRGGYWSGGPLESRSAFRNADPPLTASTRTGFRIALTP
jgi:formylglycine-generating enzyme